MSLLVRLWTRDGDILLLGVQADQFTVAIISQGRSPGKSPCEKSCCWLSNCYILRLSRTRPRVFFLKMYLLIDPFLSRHPDNGTKLPV